jgi:TRAP-type mannitol/chloroaromatic compound transport system permease large subunit
MIIGAIFLVLVLLGIPIFVALGATSLVGLAATQDVPLAAIAARTVSASDSFILLAIPLFLLAGSLMSAGGIADRLFDLARALVGHMTGGLAQVNVAFSVLNGGISGSSAARSP